LPELDPARAASAAAAPASSLASVTAEVSGVAHVHAVPAACVGAAAHTHACLEPDPASRSHSDPCVAYHDGDEEMWDANSEAASRLADALAHQVQDMRAGPEYEVRA
jgi:hypothetical protein